MLAILSSAICNRHCAQVVVGFDILSPPDTIMVLGFDILQIWATNIPPPPNKKKEEKKKKKVHALKNCYFHLCIKFICFVIFLSFRSTTHSLNNLQECLTQKRNNKRQICVKCQTCQMSSAWLRDMPTVLAMFSTISVHPCGSAICWFSTTKFSFLSKYNTRSLYDLQALLRACALTCKITKWVPLRTKLRTKLCT